MRLTLVFVAAVGLAASLRAPLSAAPVGRNVLLETEQARFRVDTRNGIVLSGEHLTDGTDVYDGVGGCYRLGGPDDPAQTPPYPARVIDEADDVLVRGTKRESARGFTAVYENPALPEVQIEKSFEPGSDTGRLVKRLRFLPRRNLRTGIEYELKVRLDREFREGSYYHCPAGIHFGQRTPSWILASEVGEGLSISRPGIGRAGEGMHAFVVCANPSLGLAAATWRYRVGGEFVKPSWVSMLGSGIRYDPRGWAMGVFSEYLAPERELSAEVHIAIVAGDHISAHRQYQRLDEWQAIVHDPSVANDQTPRWLDRVKIATMGLEGRSGPLYIQRSYGRWLNEGPKMILLGGVGGPVWSADDMIGTVYVEDAGLYQKSDGHVIHDVDWFRDFFESYRQAVPGARVGPYFLSPEVIIRPSKAMAGFATPLGPWEGLDLPSDLHYARRQWEMALRAWAPDFLYMDGAPDMGGAIDFEHERVYHNDDAIAFDRATRAAVRATGRDRIYWRNSEVNVYSDCGFAELSGAGNWREAIEAVGWRNLADRLMKVKLYERPGKWQAPLYAGVEPEYSSHVLALGFRLWVVPPSPLANAAYEVRNMRLVDGDISPCWWRDYGEIEAWALELGRSRVLSAINHDEVKRTVDLSAGRDALGLDAQRPLFIWECGPVDDITRAPLSDHVAQDLWSGSRWAHGSAIRRRLVAVVARPGERVGAEVALPPDRLRQLVLSHVPAIVYAGSGYRRNYPVSHFLDIHLDGRIDLERRRIGVVADVREDTAEVALVAPAGWLPDRLSVDGREVRAGAVFEPGATLTPVTLERGRHRLEGSFRAADGEAVEVSDVHLPADWGAFVQGRDGRALQTGEGVRASFPVEETIDPMRGSMEVVFRPQFGPDAEQTHVLVSAGRRGGSIDLYKLAGTDGLCLNIFAGGKDHPIVGSRATWTPGTWHVARVEWDIEAGHEAMYFDGEIVAQADREIAPLSELPGRINIGRRHDGLMPADCAFDRLTITDRETALLVCNFDGALINEVTDAEGTIVRSIPAGEALEVEVQGRGAGSAAWVLLRDGVHVAQGEAGPGARIDLALPSRAEDGDYALRVGAPGADIAGWAEVARFGVIPQSPDDDISLIESRELDANWDGNVISRTETVASAGRIDPTCRASVDPRSVGFDLSTGTGYSEASLVAGGVEIRGLRRLAFEVTETDDVAQPRPGLRVRLERSANSFSGLMVDFRTTDGYVRRVALATGAITDRTSRAPAWAWGAADRWGRPLLVDLTREMRMGEPRRFAVDLQPLAPDGWDDTVFVSAVLHDRLLTTRLQVRLLTREEAQEMQETDASVIDFDASVDLPALKSPVEIDGAVENAWDDAASVSSFYELGGVRRARGQTEAHIAWTEHALLFAVVCEDADVVGDATGADAPVWTGDDVEILIQPPGGPLHQFALGPAGGRYDMRGEAPEYTPRWDHAVARTDGGWAVEARIPFAAFERAAPDSGEVWRLAICRSDCGDGRSELSCWPAHRERSFRSVADLADARFVDQG